MSYSSGNAHVNWKHVAPLLWLLCSTFVSTGVAAAEVDCSGGVTTQDSLVTAVPICGITVVSGSEPTVNSVVIPKAVTLENTVVEQDVVVGGTGSFIGIALVKDVPGRDGGGLIAGQIGRSPFSGSGFTFFLPFGQVGDSERVTLSAGQYRLYLLADGSLVRVTLDFEELTGSTDLSSSISNDYRVEVVDTEPSGSPANLVRYGGKVRELETLGAGFQLAWVETGDAHALSHMGVCLNSGNRESDPLAYGPGCGTPEGLIGGGFTAAHAHMDHWVYADYAAQLPLAPGRWGMGGYVESASPPASVGVLAFWLALS